MADPFAHLRSHFPILSRTKYLVSHSLGAMPEEARDALSDYANVWSDRGVRGWSDRWWMMSIEVGDLIAPLIGAPPGSVVMLPNVTTAQAVVISTFNFGGARNRVVMVEGEFPSVRYVYEGLARRLGAEIVTIPHDATGTAFELERLLEAIDERTAVVPISHVLFESSFMIDVEKIAERCAAVGARLVLDVFQSAGIAPIRLKAWGAPFAVGGVLKWLCGGPGGGFLYVDPDLRATIEPSLTGWMAHDEPFAFEAPPMRYRGDALRFALGTPAIPALYAASAGPKIVAAAAGADMMPIRTKSVKQTKRIIEHADARGFALHTPRDDARRGGSVSVRIPHAREVATELNAMQILCDFRPASGVRFSPHFYTLDAEIDAAFDGVDEILRSGSWRQHVVQTSVVT